MRLRVVQRIIINIVYMCVFVILFSYKAVRRRGAVRCSRLCFRAVSLVHVFNNNIYEMFYLYFSSERRADHHGRVQRRKQQRYDCVATARFFLRRRLRTRVGRRQRGRF